MNECDLIKKKCGVDKRIPQEMIFRQNRIVFTTTNQMWREVQRWININILENPNDYQSIVI